jgi:hypothetical protein
MEPDKLWTVDFSVLETRVTVYKSNINSVEPGYNDIG